jgi:hypothetical protein
MRMPELEVSRWFNTPEPITLAGLRGRVAALHAFQMLCPGCVAHGLPQTQRLRRTFPENQLAVIGLHTVFEHHAVMGPDALEAFIHEYRIDFPVGVDRPSGQDGIPLTMAALGLRGTPSLLLFDHEGQLRLHHFGQIDDLALGAVIGQLIARSEAPVDDAAPPPGQGCDTSGCAAA